MLSRAKKAAAKKRDTAADVVGSADTAAGSGMVPDIALHRPYGSVDSIYVTNDERVAR